MAIHHLTEYSLNGGEWLQAYADEEAGPGKTLTVSGLAAGIYDVRLRITPLTGGGPAVVSESVSLVIEGGASVSESQLKQVQDIQAALSFIASGAQVAAVQVSSALGSMLFSGEVNQSQTLQSELVSGGGIIVGSLDQVQTSQSNSVASVLEYLSSVASAQSIQSEVILADYIVPITGVVEVNQSVQAEASSAALVFYGTASDSQAAQSRTVNGLLSFVGNSTVNQLAQTRTATGSLAFSGNGTETQIKQSVVINAETGSGGTVTFTPDYFDTAIPITYANPYDGSFAGTATVQGWTIANSGENPATAFSGYLFGAKIQTSAGGFAGNGLLVTGCWADDGDSGVLGASGYKLSKTFAGPFASGSFSIKYKLQTGIPLPVIKVNGVSVGTLVANNTWQTATIALTSPANILLEIEYAPVSAYSGSAWSISLDNITYS